MNAGAEFEGIRASTPIGHGLKNNAFSEVLGTVVESRWLIAGVVVLLTLVGTIHALLAQPVYRADALLQVGTRTSGIAALADFSGLSSLFNGLETRAEMKILRSRSVLGRVVDNLDLDIVASPVHVPIVGAAVARAGNSGEGVADPWFDMSGWFDLRKYGWGGEHMEVQAFHVPDALRGQVFTIIAVGGGRYKLYDQTHELLTEGMAGKAELVPLPGGGQLELIISQLRAAPGTHFEIYKKPYLEAIENLNQSLETEALDEETLSGDQALSGLVELSLVGTRPDRTSETLKEILEVYISQNVERKFANADKTLALLEEQLSALKGQMQSTETALNRYRLERGSVDLELETKVVLDKIVRVETRLSDLSRDRMELLQRFTPEHNRMVALDAQIAALDSELDGLEEEVKALPKTQQEILSLSRDAEVDRHFYSLLSNKVQELKVVKAGAVGNVDILDAVAVPVEPFKPRKVLMISMYTVLGGVLGVAAAFTRKALLGVVEDPDVIETQLGIPVYAVVPHSAKQKKCAKGDGRKGIARTVLAANNPQDVAIESLRSLRTWINFALLDGKNNMLLVTGPGPGVGKSFVSVNLGTLMASAGKRVLIIDADLRKGHLHHCFGTERNGGLSDFIAGGLSNKQVIRKTEVHKLHIITSGTLPPNPSELLANERFASILRDASSQFDHVIIDSPPILAVTDAAILGRLAAATLLVVKAGAHSLREIEQSVTRLNQAGVHLRGVVFNDMDISKHYGYGRYYSYRYAYPQ